MENATNSNIVNKTENTQDYTKKTLKLFEEFIQFFLIKKKSLADGQDLSPEATIQLVKELNGVTKLNKGKQKKNDNEENPKDKDTSLEGFLEDQKNDKYKTILWHAYWIMYLMNPNTNNFLCSDPKNWKKLIIEKPIASTQQVYTKNPIDPFKTLLSLFCHIWKKKITNINDVKKEIIRFLKKEENIDKKEENIDKRIKNLLLYLCAPKEHLPILSEDHKKNIYTNLKFILDNNKSDAKSGQKAKSDDTGSQVKGKEKSSDANTEYNDSILCQIEIQLEELLNHKQNTEYNTCSAVYDKRIKPLWLKEPKTGELPSDILLKYKKAMVLYGPPGTGKTYTAANLAKKILLKHLFEKWKNTKPEEQEDVKTEIVNILNLKEDALEEHPNISYLQFHVNYTYENFIAGQTVKTDNNNNTTLETKCGFIYDIIDKANTAIDTAIFQKKEVSIIEANNKIEVYITEGNCNESQDSNNKGQTNEETRIENIKKHITKNKELQKAINAAPFIVILDEMNRVDVSRVFGELFTAIEKRGTDVFLTLPDPNDEKKRLKLNIPYNIYFIGTMNEIDFSLEQIDFALRRRFIWELADYSENALEEIITEKIEGTENFTNFLKNCTALNKKIADSLGEEYHIGHAFFAEIANIYNELIENGSSNKAFEQAQNILWQISIRPTIEAYCGTMEKNAQKTFIDECYKVFFKTGNE